MNAYIIRYTDGQTARVQASSIESARHRGYQYYRSGTIASVDEV